MVYFFILRVFEAKSDCNHHIKSGKILIDRKASEKFRILFKTLSGSLENVDFFVCGSEKINGDGKWGGRIVTDAGAGDF